MLKSSSGSNPQIVPSSLSSEDVILSFEPEFFLQGHVAINRKKTLRNLMKQNIKEVSRLTFVDFTENPNMTNQDIKRFFDWICKFEKLSELSVNFSHKDNVWDTRSIVKNFRKFLKKIQLISNLSSLKLNLSNCTELPIDVFQGSAIKLPHLSKLSLNLSLGRQLKTEFLSDLAKNIRALTGLIELSLDFSYTKLENEGISVLMSSLEALKRLNCLKINFYGSQGLNPFVFGALCKALVSLENLHGLSINLSHCNHIDNLDVKRLICRIKKLRNLSRLCLTLVNNSLHIETIQILMGHGEQFNQLSHLALTLPLDYKCLGVSKGFERSFMPLANLTVLEIFVYDSLVRSPWTKEDTGVWEGLVTLPKLSRLCLSFHSRSLFIDQMLRSLGGILKKLGLKELFLAFYEKLIITISAWKNLFEGVDTLSDLNKFYLKLYNSYMIHLDVIQVLGENLKNIKGLVDFGLEYYTASGQGKKVLKGVDLVLRNQKDLNTVKLKFPWDHKIKSKDFWRIFLTLSEAQFLAKIDLELGSQFFPKSENEVGPIYYLRLFPSLRYLKLEAFDCDEPELLALSAQLAQLSQIISIILRFDFGRNISPKTKLSVFKNIRKLKGMKEFHLEIQKNRLYIQVPNFGKISWGMKDFYAGYDKAEIVNYERELKRLQKSTNRWDCHRYCLAFWCITLACAPGIGLLLFIILGTTLRLQED